MSVCQTTRHHIKGVCKIIIVTVGTSYRVSLNFIFKIMYSVRKGNYCLVTMRLQALQTLPNVLIKPSHFKPFKSHSIENTLFYIIEPYNLETTRNSEGTHMAINSWVEHSTEHKNCSARHNPAEPCLFQLSQTQWNSVHPSSTHLRAPHLS
jgi:hypothetical protein